MEGRLGCTVLVVPRRASIYRAPWLAPGCSLEGSLLRGTVPYSNMVVYVVCATAQVGLHQATTHHHRETTTPPRRAARRARRDDNV